MADALGALTPLWGMSLTAAYAAGIVFLLRLALKKRAPRQAVCLLWLIVFTRLLLPFSLQSPLSAVPQALAEGARPAVSQSEPHLLHRHRPLLQHPPFPDETQKEARQRLASGYEYTLTFPVTLVRTPAGWRVDQFQCTASDGEYTVGYAPCLLRADNPSGVRSTEIRLLQAGAA